MKTSDTLVQTSAPSEERPRWYYYPWVVAGIVGTYVSARLAVWIRVPNLEDHDSASYLVQALHIRSDGLSAFNSFSPDATPAYPLFSALLSLFGGSMEASARLFSFLASLLLLAAFWGIGRRITDRDAILYGALLLALHPFMIRLSPAVLTEPSYIAIVYLGLWLFLGQVAQPTVFKSAMLGALFGLAFLTRFEGILFFAFIPVLQLAHWLMTRDRAYGLRRLAASCIVFITLFSAVAAPQVWRVSEAMDRFALNGRQVWSVILAADDGRSYEEKIYGLDYSDREINLRYLQANPAVAATLEGGPNVERYLRLAVNNFDELYQNRLGRLIGPLIFGAFLLGLLSLLRARHLFSVLAICMFLGVLLLAPILYTVAPRNLAVIIPIVLLVAGIGVRDVVGGVRDVVGESNRRWVPALVLLIFLAPSANQLRLTMDTIRNNEYDAEAVKVLARTIQTVGAERPGPPRVAARKSYVAYEAGATDVPLPYTDLEGLIRYLEANSVDFLYLNSFYLQRRTFAEYFMEESRLPPEFELLYEGEDRFGRRLMLYRVLVPRLEEPNAGVGALR